MEHRFLIIVALVLASLTSIAHADTRVVVRSFPGPGGALVRRAVVKELTRADVTVVEEASAERTAKRRGVSLGGALGKKEVARELEISAWVEGRIVRRGGKLHAKITVEDAAQNEEVDSWNLARKKPKQLEQAVKGVGPKIVSAVQNTSAPESEYTPPEKVDEPVPVASTRQTYDSELPPAFSPTGDEEQQIDGDQGEPRKRGTMSALEANVGMGIMNRSLSYNDAFSQNVGDYSLAAAPVADLGLKVFPAAFFRDGWPTYIGLDLRAQLGFALASEASDGTRYDTQYHSYSASILGRYPIKQHEVHAALGYGAQAFRVKDADGQPAPVPDVDYRALRLGGGGKFALVDWLTMGADLTWLVLTSVGELSDDEWFPRATGAGIEGQLYADATVFGPIDARLYASYQRQFFDFNSEPGDTRVAGGAADGYLTAGIGLGYRY